MNGRKELLAFLSVLLGPALVSLENRLRNLSDRPEEPLWCSRMLPFSVDEGTPITVSAYMHSSGNQASNNHHLPLVPPMEWETLPGPVDSKTCRLVPLGASGPI